MGAELTLLLAWVAVGAAFLVVQVVNMWLGLRATSLPWRWRLVALVPPAAPVVAWAGGRRFAPLLWATLLVTYVALRLVG